ncbi:conjugative transposon protein [Proteus mirabilis HI4320]|uniref:Conjugative transposon protein n=1 Tax=Proteus mirabilis (strain HI4320) TaxID=529507 RepID=B4EWV4_PROMH|nr:conjugative transposon protein [Proteus mirabilis HI4320]
MTVKTVDVPLYAKAILKVSDTDTKQTPVFKGLILTNLVMGNPKVINFSSCQRF